MRYRTARLCGGALTYAVAVTRGLEVVEIEPLGVRLARKHWNPYGFFFVTDAATERARLLAEHGDTFEIPDEAFDAKLIDGTPSCRTLDELIPGSAALREECKRNWIRTIAGDPV